MKGGWFQAGRRQRSLPVDDRGLQYGDGLFETIAIRNGKPRLWDMHVDRLQTGGARLAIEIPRAEELRADLDRAIVAAGESGRAIAKIIVTRGSGRRGYRYFADSLPRTLIGMFESSIEPATHWSEGVAVRLCSLRLGCQPALAGIKSLNRLEQVLARSEWHNVSIAEGLMMDTVGNVICGTMCNVFFVKGSRVLTPSITESGICGVMRRHIIAEMDAAKINLTVEPVPFAALRDCSEMFLCNSQIGAWPVRECAGTPFVAPGPVTREVMERLARSGIEECQL